jgi:tagatose-1,6-bisphosphate aldolase non-catalytic subunit AgaZ/GatZ
MSKQRSSPVAASRQVANGTNRGTLSMEQSVDGMREAVFGLSQIEDEWIPEARRSSIRSVIDRVMIEHPENWRSYYRGDDLHLKVARSSSFSDRIRYY